ncbi:MAG TPA: hypothetical protein VER14_09810 [Phototrophicaceae bacterium]|nr:hypothetical protein [Phototrophicaceae bacterium]
MQKKNSQKKEREIFKILETQTRLDELAEVLAKATTTNPKKNK